MKKLFTIFLLLMMTLISCTNKNIEAEDVNMENVNKIKYLGHGSLKMYLKNGSIGYIDPYAGDDYNDKADFIFVTHQHGDHNQLDLIDKKDNCVIIQNFDAIKDGAYQSFDVCGMHVEATEAYNKNHKKEECVGYIFTFDDGKIVYVAGDTSTTKQMESLDKYNIDYAFLPMDGVYNMDIDEAIKCEKLIKAKHTIPYHIAPGELFDEERANLFKTDTTYILKPDEMLSIE